MSTSGTSNQTRGELQGEKKAKHILFDKYCYIILLYCSVHLCLCTEQYNMFMFMSVPASDDGCVHLVICIIHRLTFLLMSVNWENMSDQ